MPFISTVTVTPTLTLCRRSALHLDSNPDPNPHPVQEKRVLFISTVLTHNIKQHHLVFNPKRFNVAVTRAKACSTL